MDNAKTKYSQQNSNMKAAALLFPVIYTQTRPILNKDIIKAFEIANKKIVPNENVKANLTVALLTKSRIWKYEKEWRIVTPVKDNLREYSFDCISSIYIGACASIELKTYLNDFCEKFNIDINQYSIDIKNYELVCTNQN